MWARRCCATVQQAEWDDRVAHHPEVLCTRTLQLYHGSMHAVRRAARIIGKLVISESHWMPLVPVLKPDVDEASRPVHLEVKAINRAECKLKILHIEIGLVDFEVTNGT